MYKPPIDRTYSERKGLSTWMLWRNISEWNELHLLLPFWFICVQQNVCARMSKIRSLYLEKFWRYCQQKLFITLSVFHGHQWLWLHQYCRMCRIFKGKGFCNSWWSVCKGMSFRNDKIQGYIMSIYFWVCCANSFLLPYFHWVHSYDNQDDFLEKDSEKEGGIFTSKNLMYMYRQFSDDVIEY